VRQGGILSADLYKLYINPLLERLENSHIGSRIGNVLCNASACADDVALMSRTDSDLQIQINMAQDFAGMEGYKLQPKKSVSIHIRPVKTRALDKVPFMLGTEEMSMVENATHLGIIRTGSLKQNVTQNVEENIKKARRSAYALLGNGFHGENGLDPETSIHLYKIYIQPVLLYGMQLITPKGLALEQLEKFQKKILKQLLSVPPNTPDPAIYILSGILPIEAQIHIKVLNFYNNVCNQAETSIEKQLARRQLSIKAMNSNSWFIDVENILYKCLFLLETTIEKGKME